MSIHGLGHWESWGQRLVHQIHSGHPPIFGEKTLRQTPLRQQVRVNEMISNVYSINILCFFTTHTLYIGHIEFKAIFKRYILPTKIKKFTTKQHTNMKKKAFLHPIYTMGPPQTEVFMVNNPGL